MYRTRTSVFDFAICMVEGNESMERPHSRLLNPHTSHPPNHYIHFRYKFFVLQKLYLSVWSDPPCLRLVWLLNPGSPLFIHDSGTVKDTNEFPISIGKFPIFHQIMMILNAIFGTGLESGGMSATQGLGSQTDSAQNVKQLCSELACVSVAPVVERCEPQTRHMPTSLLELQGLQIPMGQDDQPWY
jgi:hypothetical protein